MRVPTSDTGPYDYGAGARPSDRSTATPATPDSRRSRRILGVDAARGVALLAMMSVHVYPEVNEPELGYYSDRTLAHVLVAGRAAAAFALLAGVALVLATARTPLLRARLAVAARAVAVAAIGLTLGYADSGLAVILVNYALLFAVAVALLGLSARTLAALAVMIMAGVPVLSHLLRADLDPSSWQNPTFTLVAADPAGWLVELTLTGFYPVLAWTGYLCAGMAIGKCDLRAGRSGVGLLVGGAGLAVAASASSWLLLGPLGGRDAIVAARPQLPPEAVDASLSNGWFGATPTDSWWFLSLDAPHSTTPFDLFHTTGTSMALLGAMLLLSRVVRPIPLAAVGGMTLTLYVTHALALASHLLPADPTQSYLLQGIGALVVASAWWTTGLRGPLEAVVALISRTAARAAGPFSAGPVSGGPVSAGPVSGGPVSAPRQEPPAQRR